MWIFLFPLSGVVPMQQAVSRVICLITLISEDPRCLLKLQRGPPHKFKGTTMRTVKRRAILAPKRCRWYLERLPYASEWWHCSAKSHGRYSRQRGWYLSEEDAEWVTSKFQDVPRYPCSHQPWLSNGIHIGCASARIINIGL